MRNVSLLLSVLLAAACSSEDVCDPVARSGCDDGFVCEHVDGADDPQCVAPLVIRGNVFDLVDGGAVAGARVMALDVNRSPVSSVAVTDANGNYVLEIPSARAEDGSPHAVELTLRAEASGFDAFPKGLRVALPIDTATAVDEGDRYVVESTLTSIGLLALADTSAKGTLSGTVSMPDNGAGVLVVAESSGIGYSTFADRDGDYTLFNLPDGEYQVAGYSRGYNYVRPVATIAEANTLEGVDLAKSDEPTSSLTGMVSITNGGGGTATSVIVVVASTYDEVLQRGETPPGLRAPAPGTAPDVSGAFTIDGIPTGDYRILAAFEDDLLVRDPDTCISGTDVLQQSFANGDVIDSSDNSFKVTGALSVIGPGADGAEAISGTPTFSWVDDSSEIHYDLVVYDAFGNTVWEHEEPSHSGDNPQVAYAGPALEVGMYYQFRVTSVRSRNTELCEISTTEDLKGVFYITQ